MNHVIIIGHLGADPESRQTQKGKMVCNFSVATNTRQKDGANTTTWHKVVTWDRQAEVCAAYLRRGSKVAVAGRLQTRKYEDKEGRTRSSTEIVAHMVNFLDPRSDSEGKGAAGDPSPSVRVGDELPF